MVATQGPGSSKDAEQLEAEAEALRRKTLTSPTSLDTHLELAFTLQQLNHYKPDGGKRLPEAEAAYRWG